MVLGHNIETGSRTQDVQISQDITFENMLLTSQTLKGLNESGFYKPSPVQLHGVPLGKCGFDLLLEAKSGTGKTAVFTIIALEKLELNKGLQTIILTPTREIAAQICDVIKQIGSQFKGLVVEVVIGGLSVKEDIDKFKTKNVHILVGSPGRLKHLMQDGHIVVSAVRLLILDEADKLMEKSFQTDINYINSLLPNQKQIILSSATYPENVKPFIKKIVPNGQHICPDSSCVLLGVHQKVTTVKHNVNIVKQTQYRFEEVLKILSRKQFKQCLIFCNYQARVVELRRMLIKAKWPAEHLYGNQEQTDRLDALKTLQEYKCRILISTDLAARGIDASNVDLIINFEPPFEWQTYLHRIGRAGRYGSYGEAVTILSKGKEENKFYQLLKSLKVSINSFWQANLFENSNETEQNKINNGTLPQIKPESINAEKFKESISTTKSKDYDALWEILTFKTDKKLEELESFTSLCTSFTEEVSAEQPAIIETFSDLLSSFQSHKNDAVVEKNKNFNTNDLSAKISSSKECFSYMNSKDEDIFELSQVAEGKCGNDVESKHTAESIHNKNETNHILSTKPDIPITTRRSSNTDICEKAEEATVEYVFETMDDELAKAGLPTAFGSSKDTKTSKKNISIKQNKDFKQAPNKNYQKQNYRKTEQNGDETLCQSKVISKPNPKGPINIKQSSANNIEKKINTVNLSNRRYEETESSVSESTDSSENECSGYSDDSSNYSEYDSSELIDNINSKINNMNYVNTQSYYQRPSQNFINWYNQLKLNASLVQLAVYIDEISKL